MPRRGLLDMLRFQKETHRYSTTTTEQRQDVERNLELERETTESESEKGAEEVVFSRAGDPELVYQHQSVTTISTEVQPAKGMWKIIQILT